MKSSSLVHRANETIAMAALALSLLGCGEDEAVGKAPLPPVAEAEQGAPSHSEHSLKVFVASPEKPEERQLVKVQPADLGSNTSDADTGSGDGPPLDEQIGNPGASLRPMAVVREGNEETDTEENDADKNYADGWTLLYWATKSCYDKDLAPEATLHLHSAPWKWFTPEKGMFYLFHDTDPGRSTVSSCDAALFMQETLLCAADRLAQIGDSPGTVTWEVPTEPAVQGEDDDSPAIVVTVPPQATKDVFIARDMAMNALAHVAQLDHTTINGANCTRRLRVLAESGEVTMPIFGTNIDFIDPTEFSKNTTSLNQLRGAGRRRLSRKANVLIGAGRLVQDLVERSVRDDISGAEQQRTGAADGLRGARAAWGKDEGQPPYNTLRHALRVLYGRIEIGNHRDPLAFNNDGFLWDANGPKRDDPRCDQDGAGLIEFEDGQAALNLVDSLMPGQRARWNDMPPKTPGEALALSTLDRAGIVVPPNAVELADESGPDVRAAVVNQLMKQAAERADTEMTLEEYRDSLQGQAYAEVLDGISDEEFRFALGRTFDAFRLLAEVNGIDGTDDDTIRTNLRTAGENAGLNVQSSAEAAIDGEDDVDDLGGIVVMGSAPREDLVTDQSGLPRQDLAIDITSKLRRVQRASNCGVFAEGTTVSARLGDALSAHSAHRVTSFQNPFLLADAFRRKLGILSFVESGTEDDEDLSEIRRFAELAASEIQEWAGPGTMLREYTGGTSENLYLLNIKPEDLGLASVADVEARLAYHTAAFPECVAGLRESCPGNPFDPNNPDIVRILPETAIPYTNSGLVDVDSWAGFERGVIRVTLPHVAGSVNVVILADDGKPGRVLGNLRGTDEEEQLFIEPISTRQTELANRVFGTDTSEELTRTCTNIAPLSISANYCIEGMKRDQFVPLANELTTEGSVNEDSWRHYLDLAEQAAFKADELGNEMIRAGLEQDIRKEAAAEAVGELCGAFGTVDNTTTENGELSLSQDDAQLNACIGGDKYDIVFLRNDPLVGMSDAAIRAVYCVDGVNPQPPFCSEEDNPDIEDEIRHAGLDFLTSTVKPVSGKIEEACASVTGALASADGTLDGVQYGNAVGGPWASSGALGSTLESLYLEIQNDGQWILSVGQRPIMGSDALVSQRLLGTSYSNADVWPFCANYSDVTCSGIARHIGKLFAPWLAEEENYEPGTLYPALRADVERTLFYLGALAGYIPPGHISMPVPAVDRSVVTTPVPAPALYGASFFDGTGLLTADGYEGKPEWTGDQGSLLGTTAPFDTTYAQSRITLPVDTWRDRVYEGAASGGYRAISTSNEVINFNSDVAPGISRDVLQSWLSGLSQKYMAGPDGEITTDLQQATFYTPGIFCKSNGTYAHSRHVCADAKVSPTFATTYDSWANEGCGADTTGELAPLPNDKLVATVVVDNAADLAGGLGAGLNGAPPGWFSVYGTVGLTSESCSSCAHPKGSVYRWATTPNAGCIEFDAAQGTVPPWDVPYSAENHCDHAPWHTNAFRDGDGFLHWPQDKTRRLSHERLMPSECPPSARLEMFLETDLLNRVHGMQTLLRGVGMSCLHSTLHLDTSLKSLPPPVSSPEDIRLLEAWLNRAGYAIDQVANLYYVVDVPDEVVQIAKEGGANVGAVTAGTRGQLLLDLEQKLRLIENGYATVGTTFQMISSEIQKTRLEIEATDIANRQRQLDIAAAKINNDRDLALAQVQAAATVAKAVVFNVADPEGTAEDLIDAQAAIAALQINSSAHGAIQSNLAQQAALSNESSENQEALAVVNLSEAITGLFQSLRDNVTGIKNNVSSSLQTVGALQQNESKARIALAKAAGADFVEVQGVENPVPLHVNTVMRRQFSLLKERYDRALQSAKRSAYLARLSVEQRLGVRLDDLHQSIGPLEAPAVWVDNLCTAQGVDYNKLRTAEEDTTDEEEVDLIAGFADQYVGDYVAKLKEFIEFYNLQYPFRESDDVAVVSLREDLPGSLLSCVSESKNLLYYSDQLDSCSTEFGQPEVVSHGGWNVTGCDTEGCIEVLGGGALTDPAQCVAGTPGCEVLVPPEEGGVTWLRTVERVEVDQSVWEHQSPAASAFQTVSLRAAQRYVLSWWDMARGSTGGPFGSGSPDSYRASVFNGEWKLIGGEVFGPETDGWSERRTIEFSAPEDGEYHVVFSPGPANDFGASLAIANVQLEEQEGNAGGATAYQHTSGSRTSVTGNCAADSAKDFRSRFEHRCDQLGCWFELRDVLAIDTELLNQGATSLIGQVAPGNFNYRSGGVAVNVVGTGVIDCEDSGSASCYGSAYVEYDLQHVAYSVPMEDYESNVRCFDFGAGNIRGGKALAAERFITLPMSSTDKEMVNQSPFLKPEFTGRPLSGSYRLRIKDSPSLSWENVDDVQMILNYSYWSRVERSPGN